VKVEGSCHCGQITYEAVVDPGKVTACHCTDCQVLSGSPYRSSARAARETFSLLSGRLKTYVKTAESGNKRVHAFCPECGSPVYSCAIDNPPAYALRVGCLRQRALLPPRRQIWCRSALDWSRNLQDVPQSDRQ
jgi:hypothetical protein